MGMLAFYLQYWFHHWIKLCAMNLIIICQKINILCSCSCGLRTWTCTPCLEFGHGMTFSYNATPLMQCYAFWIQVNLNIYRRDTSDIIVAGPLFVHLVRPRWSKWPLWVVFLKAKVDLLVFSRSFASFGKSKISCILYVLQYYSLPPPPLHMRSCLDLLVQYFLSDGSAMD